MRKKLTIIFLAVVVLFTKTAIAATYEDFYDAIIQKEAEQGIVEDWTCEDLIWLIDWMVELGEINVTDSISSLTRKNALESSETHELALAIIHECYNARDGAITVADIIAKEKGNIENWSLEDKAWFTERMQTYNSPLLGTLYSVYLLPDASQGDLTQESVLQIANSVIETVFGESILQNATYTISFVLSKDMEYRLPGDEENQVGTLRLWMVDYKSKASESFSVHLRNDGVIISVYSPWTGNVLIDSISIP